MQNNPEAFADAYWSVNALKVYNNNGQQADTSPVQSSAVMATSTSMVYVTPSPSSAAQPTTFAVSTTASDDGYAPVVGPSGAVGWGSPSESEASSTAAPAAPSGGGWFSNAPNGAVGSLERDVVEIEPEMRRGERHARHLRSHIKRHSGRRL